MMRHLAHALREQVGLRRQWLRVARSLPPDARLSWGAEVVGRVRAGARTSIGSGAVLHAGDSPAESITIGADCRVHPGARLYTWRGSIVIGDHSSINTQSVLYGTGGIRIGSCVRIAAMVAIIASDHRFGRTDLPVAHQGYTALGIQIEDDVWIGAGVCILDGVRIGKGAIIGAGAVVTKSVAESTVVAGVPAVVIRDRNMPA